MATTSSQAATQLAAQELGRRFSGSLTQVDAKGISRLFSQPSLGTRLDVGPIRLPLTRARSKSMCRSPQLLALAGTTRVCALVPQRTSAQQALPPAASSSSKRHPMRMTALRENGGTMTVRIEG